MVRLKPHLASSGSPFMNNITGALFTSFPRRSSRGATLGAPSASCSSPSAASSFRISNPPISSPFEYTCGYVGHFEYSLRPCRTSSSPKISKKPYFTLLSLSIPVIVRLKPHFSSPGDPFIKSITGSLLMSCFRRVFKSTAGAPAPAAAPPNAGPGAAAGLRLPELLKSIAFFEISGAFAPTINSDFPPPFCRKTNAGTDSTL
mmetsp:Transcript_11500/g.16425  ORF Transcript_11500/g.16425 Transcript_11500/m.16425 type:complete len:203 (-) Transcript_11500:205-813(-)